MSEIESRIDLEQIEQQQWRIDLSRVSSAVLVSLIMYGKSNWHWMVFAYQISLKPIERDVYDFFSRTGKLPPEVSCFFGCSLWSYNFQVRDVRLIMDCNSRRSKRVGYVQIGMVSGLHVSVNGNEFSPASLLSELNEIGGEISNMVKNEDSSSPRWSASLFMQTTEDVARAVAAAAAAASTVRSPRPSVVFSSKDDNGNSPLHKLQRQVSRVLKGFSQPPEVKSGTYIFGFVMLRG